MPKREAVPANIYQEAAAALIKLQEVFPANNVPPTYLPHAGNFNNVLAEKFVLVEHPEFQGLTKIQIEDSLIKNPQGHIIAAAILGHQNNISANKPQQNEEWVASSVNAKDNEIPEGSIKPEQKQLDKSPANHESNQEAVEAWKKLNALKDGRANSGIGMIQHAMASKFIDNHLDLNQLSPAEIEQYFLTSIDDTLAKTIINQLRDVQSMAAEEHPVKPRNAAKVVSPQEQAKP